MNGRGRAAWLILLMLVGLVLIRGGQITALVQAQFPSGQAPMPQIVPNPYAEPPAADAPPPPTSLLPPPHAFTEPVDPPVPQVAVRVRVAAQVQPDQELTYHLTVENTSSATAHHVRLRNSQPSNARFVRSTPEPTTREPHQWLWELGTLAAHARKEITLVVLPSGSGDLECCARVQFEHGQCVRTRLARPNLRLRKLGPKQATLYEALTFQLEVTNTGTAKARDVILKDELPEGLEFTESKVSTPGNNPLVWKLGSLEAGQSRRIEYVAVAKRTGALTNHAVVEANGLPRREASSTVQVGEAKLKLELTGPERRLINRPVTYQLTVTNTGDRPASGIRLVDELDETVGQKVMVFVHASAGGRLVGRHIEWSLAALAPGERRTVTVTARAPEAGKFENLAKVTADYGLSAQARTDTLFEKGSGLSAEIDKSASTFIVGGEGIYTIRLVNAGATPLTNLAVQLTVPDEMRLVDLAGPTSATRGEQTVHFAPLSSLAPGVDVTYTVRVQPLQPGTAALKVEATTDPAPPSGPYHWEEKTINRNK